MNAHTEQTHTSNPVETVNRKGPSACQNSIMHIGLEARQSAQLSDLSISDLKCKECAVGLLNWIKGIGSKQRQLDHCSCTTAPQGADALRATGTKPNPRRPGNRQHGTVKCQQHIYMSAARLKHADLTWSYLGPTPKASCTSAKPCLHIAHMLTQTHPKKLKASRV